MNLLPALRRLLRPQKPPPLPGHALWYYEGMAFEPHRWNDPRTRRLSNCYSYAINIRIRSFLHFAPQPGQIGLPFWKYLLSQFVLTRKTITGAASADGLIPYDLSRPVPPGYYLTALMYRPGLLLGDYHWYRLDRGHDGAFFWTHKAGTAAATRRDRSGAVIHDLSEADLGIYKPCWGGYFLVPKDRLPVIARAEKIKTQSAEVKFHAL